MANERQGTATADETTFVRNSLSGEIFTTLNRDDDRCFASGYTAGQTNQNGTQLF